MIKNKYLYTVLAHDEGQEPTGKRYPIEAVGTYPPGIAEAAAEDFHGRPESAGASWPLTFVILNLQGEEIGRHQVKTWTLPCFLTMDPQRAPRGATPHFLRWVGDRGQR